MPLEPFIDNERPRQVASATMGYNTSEFDKFRQGVEITTNRHRFDGPLKISAGSDDHTFVSVNYGQGDVEFEAFSDIDVIDGTTVVSGTIIEPVIVTGQRTLPLEVQFDGVLEPLSIRLAASRNSIDFPNEVHSIVGHVQSGNEDLNGRCDMVSDTYDVRYNFLSAFIDSAETFWSSSVQLPGFLSDIETYAFAYNDVEDFRPLPAYPEALRLFAVNLGLTPITVIDDTMDLITYLSGSTEFGIGHHEIRVTAGFDYARSTPKIYLDTDSVAGVAFFKTNTPFYLGTDSIAFGGLTQ